MLLTAAPSENGALSAVRSGVVAYLDKAITPDRLVRVLQDVGCGDGRPPAPVDAG